MKVINVFGSDRRVGCTNFSIAMSKLLAEKGYKTLLICADRVKWWSRYFKTEEKSISKIKYEILGNILSDTDLKENLYLWKGVYILPPNNSSDVFNLSCNDFKCLISAVDGSFQVVIVDWGKLSKEKLEASNDNSNCINLILADEYDIKTINSIICYEKVGDNVEEADRYSVGNKFFLVGVGNIFYKESSDNIIGLKNFISFIELFKKYDDAGLLLLKNKSYYRSCESVLWELKKLTDQMKKNSDEKLQNKSVKGLESNEGSKKDKIYYDDVSGEKEDSIDDKRLKLNHLEVDAEAKYEKFDSLCERIKSIISEEWEQSDDSGKERKLRREKDCLLGKEYAVSYYRLKIEGLVKTLGMENTEFPHCYRDLYEGVLYTLYGLGPISSWVYDLKKEYVLSSSAKIIGERMYFLIDGVCRLQEEKITRAMSIQIKKNALLANPNEREDKGFHEIYLKNGIRLTIYSGNKTKEGEDIFVFRKYLIRNLTFENLAFLKTIPCESVDLFKIMVDIGFNCIFSGPVRSGKTTMLQIWESYEDDTLEGLAISTDPETPWHEIKRDAPIMQLIADGDHMAEIYKSLLRGDNDYVILEEMRDAYAYKLAIDIASSGTKRCKATIHSSNAIEIPYKMAWNTAYKFGGSLRDIIWQIYSNFNFVLEMKSRGGWKYVSSINFLSYDYKHDRISLSKIMEYDASKGVYEYSVPNHLFEAIEMQGFDTEKCKNFIDELQTLSDKSPMEEKTIFPKYY